MPNNFNTNLTNTDGPDFASFEITGGPTGGSAIQHSAIFLLADPTGTPFAVAPGTPLPVDLGLVSPQAVYSTSASLAAGASVDVDSSTVPDGVTAKLLACYITSSVPLVGMLKTVLNGTPSSVLGVVFSQSGDRGNFDIPHRDFFTITGDATAGFDGFRVSVTNLSVGTQAADVHVMYYYDEV